MYNISGFSEFGNWSDIQKPKHEQYFNYPGNSVIVNGKIYLLFENSNTGIWVINIRYNQVKLENAFQKKIGINNVIQDGNSTKIITNYYNIPTLTKLVFNKYTNCIYFVSESFYDNARILKINLTNSNYFNNSELYTLNGINNIKDIKIDFLNNNFYLLTGQVSSNIYKLDMDFNIIPVSSECGIESLSLPSDWNSGQNMEIDYITGIIYVLFSHHTMVL